MSGFAVNDLAVHELLAYYLLQLLRLLLKLCLPKECLLTAFRRGYVLSQLVGFFVKYLDQLEVLYLLVVALEQDEQHLRSLIVNEMAADDALVFLGLPLQDGASLLRRCIWHTGECLRLSLEFLLLRILVLGLFACALAGVLWIQKVASAMVDEISEVAVAHRLHGIGEHKYLPARVDKHSLGVIFVLAAEPDELALCEAHA